jgi:hypothetical protein
MINITWKYIRIIFISKKIIFNIPSIRFKNTINRVFNPDPVQGPGSRFWLGHQVTRVNFIFLKSKWRHFRKKTNVNGLQSSFWPGHPWFWLFLFFLKLSSVWAPNLLDPRLTHWVGFQNYNYKKLIF